MKLTLRHDLRVEAIDGEALVLDRGGETVQRVRGKAVEALRLVVAGVDEDVVPDRLVGAMAELEDAGFLTEDNRWSRRKLLVRGGVGVAAASVATFALASPAWAVSDCPSPPSGMLLARSTSTNIDATGTYYFSPMTTSVALHVWGAGGGGGALGSGNNRGGGGGGGEYRGSTAFTVTPCTNYTITIGTGGAIGMSGGATTFSTITANGGSPGTNGAMSGGAGGTGGSGGTLSANGGAGAAGSTGGGTTTDNGGGGGGGAGFNGTVAVVGGAAGAPNEESPGAGGGTAPTQGGAGGAGGNAATAGAGSVPGGGGGGGDVGNLANSGGGGRVRIVVS